MIHIKILSLKNNHKPNCIEIKAILGKPEFKHLYGELDCLCVFPTNLINENCKVIMTGARHSHAKYFLFPKALRKKLKAQEYDFLKISCGTVEYKDMVFVVYGIPRKDLCFQETASNP